MLARMVEMDWAMVFLLKDAHISPLEYRVFGCRVYDLWFGKALSVARP
jgi:hypothetical protein